MKEKKSTVYYVLVRSYFDICATYFLTNLWILMRIIERANSLNISGFLGTAELIQRSINIEYDKN